jgi:hypothetical protein
MREIDVAPCNRPVKAHYQGRDARRDCDYKETGVFHVALCTDLGRQGPRSMGCSRVRNLVPESGACLLGDRTVSRLQQASRETDLKKFKNFSKGNAVSANLLRGSVRIFAGSWLRRVLARCCSRAR